MSASLADLRKKEVNNVKYDTVEAYGTTVRIGSVSSHDMLLWMEENSDLTKRKRAGLRLLVKSIVDDNGDRYPEGEHEAVLADFELKDALDNGKVVKAALILNGFPIDKTDKDGKPVTENPEATVAERKNDSGQTT